MSEDGHAWLHSLSPRFAHGRSNELPDRLQPDLQIELQNLSPTDTEELSSTMRFHPTESRIHEQHGHFAATIAPQNDRELAEFAGPYAVQFTTR